MEGNDHLDDSLVTLAAEAIRGAEALVIAAGAGMGVDSGLPDFRGNQGFWRAYPPYASLGLSFVTSETRAEFTQSGGRCREHTVNRRHRSSFRN